jgi:hypothetical protein
MRKLSTFVIAAALIASMAPRAHSIGAFLSYWNGKDTDNGYGVGINHQLKIIPLVHGDLRASWLSFDDSNLDLFPLEAMARVKLTMFYVGAGVGYYIFSGGNDVNWDNSWGAFGVGGVELTVAKIGVFGELKYTWVDTKIEDTMDVDGNGIGVNVGVVFNWI